jgi:hypothetical protein
MINIVVIISLILNAVLIASVVGWLPLSMFLSGLLNIGLLWYLRNLFLQIEERNEDMVEMFEQLEHFSVHLEDIHGLEMFYNFDEYYERYSDEELEEEEEEVIAPTQSQEEEE